MITTVNKELTVVLNDLIEINNDRVTGYEKAANEIGSKDTDLQTTFHHMAMDSQKYAEQIRARVRELGGEPTTNATTNSGKIYRVWMDVKGAFTGNDRKTVLENCEFGEDAAQKAYKMALDTDDAEWDADTRQLITSQKSSLKAAHDVIKSLRDSTNS